MLFLLLSFVLGVYSRQLDSSHNETGLDLLKTEKSGANRNKHDKQNMSEQLTISICQNLSFVLRRISRSNTCLHTFSLNPEARNSLASQPACPLKNAELKQTKDSGCARKTQPLQLSPKNTKRMVAVLDLCISVVTNLKPFETKAL